MLVEAKLRFLEVKEKKKFGSDEKYPIIVLYDENKEQLIKPYCEKKDLERMNLLKPYDVVEVELDIYDGKNGMVCRFVGVKGGKKMI